MKRFLSAAAIALTSASLAAAAPGSALRGYSVAGSDAERRLETQIVDVPSAQSALATATFIGSRPHAAGTHGDYAVAAYVRDRLRAAGIAAVLVPLRARIDTPRELVLELAPPADLAGTPPRRRQRGRAAAFPIAFDLREHGSPADPATQARTAGLPFDAGSGDGDVSAPLVFAGRGRDADYLTLGQAGVDVRGAVVLLRSGADAPRRMAERAQAQGAAGIIFYADPADDGAARGLVAPDGPWHPADAVERGWVGDDIRIPVLPISAANAQTLLAALDGPAGPAGWSGALPVVYPLARGPGRVHLIVKLNRTTTTLWNTIGVIAGVRGDQSVIIGAPRDAAVYGVGQNGAGVTTLVETARGLGFLLGGGWRPQRTIVLAAWDGSEQGSSGARAYAANHRFELERGCIAYLDASQTVSGSVFAPSGSAALAPLVVEIARTIPDPVTPALSVYAAWAAAGPRGVPPPPTAGPQAAAPTRIGTPSARLAFTGAFGVGGSTYDTLTYATRVSDPDFELHRTAAQLYGALTLRLADAVDAPYALAAYGPALRAAAAALQLPPTPAGTLRRAVDRFARTAVRFDRAAANGTGGGVEIALRTAGELDAVLEMLGAAAPGPADAGTASAAIDRASRGLEAPPPTPAASPAGQ